MLDIGRAFSIGGPFAGGALFAGGPLNDGSVGIAGSQTGMYPAESPGGWQLIGRTTIRLFDLTRPNPFLLEPGDDVEFVAEG